MNSKSPVSASVVMLVVAVFVLGGLTGYIAGTSHGAQVAAAAPPQPAAAGAGCAMMGQDAGKGGASACPMMAGKDKTAKATTGKPAACPMGGEKGACADKANCPDAGKCPTPGAKSAATCPMGGDKAKGGMPAACPMSGAKAAKPAAATQAKGAVAAKAVYGCSMCPDVKSDKPGKCPKCGMDLIKK